MHFLRAIPQLLLAALALAGGRFAAATEIRTLGFTEQFGSAPAQVAISIEKPISLFPGQESAAYPPKPELAELAARADAGDAAAQARIGIALVNWDVPLAKGNLQALALFQRAAAQHSVAAECWLGLMYAEGLGTAADTTRARFYLETAVSHGSRSAESYLGSAYEEGRLGLKPDREAALAHYRHAAQEGEAKAMRQLIQLLAQHPGHPEERDAALYWAWRTAMAGYSVGFLQAAHLCAEGTPSQPPNADLAWICTTVASRHGFAEEERQKRNVDFRRDLARLLSPGQREQDDAVARLYDQRPNFVRPDLSDQPECAFQYGQVVTFAYLQSQIILAVFVNGQGPYRFMFDTGAPCSAIDPALARSLHLRTLGGSPSRKGCESFFSLFAASLTFGGQEVKRAAIEEEESLESISQLLGSRVDGIIGSDAAKRGGGDRLRSSATSIF